MEGDARWGAWRHYQLEVPPGAVNGVQVRVELLQPGRVTYGARLFVHGGAVDCGRTRGFDYTAERPEQCEDGTCEVIMWTRMDT